MKYFASFAALLPLLFLAAPARADVGGEVPGPGGCDYPMIGTQGMEFGVYDYACAGPTEVNGSHWQAFYGGAAAQGTVGIGVGIQIAFFNAGVNASLSAPVGVLRGVQYWACPDLSVAEAPNPIGAWSGHITPTKCKTVSPKPGFLDAPPPEPIGPPNPLAPPPPLPETTPQNTPQNTPDFPKAM